MPKLIKKRLDKEEQEGDLRETIGDIRERMKERQRTLIYGLVAFVVAISIIVSFVVYKRVTAAKALDFEAKGYAFFYGAPDNSSLPPAERYKKALEMFRLSYEAKKNPVVLLYVANCLYEMGNYDEAISTLKKLNAEFSDLNVVPLSYFKLAMAYEKKNDLPNALEALKSVYSIKNAPLQDLALLESGKIFEAQGKADDAKNAYRELIKRFPRSPLVDEAKARLGEK